MFNKWIQVVHLRTSAQTKKPQRRYQNIIGPHMYWLGWKPSLAQQVQVKPTSFKFQQYFVPYTDIKQQRINVTVQCYFTVYEAVVSAAIRQRFTKVYKTEYQRDKRTQLSKHGQVDKEMLWKIFFPYCFEFSFIITSAKEVTWYLACVC